MWNKKFLKLDKYKKEIYTNLMLEREKLSDKLTKIIGDRIIFNELKSGDLIYETQLSKEWGVSRSPVRDSLHWLESRRLVEKAPKGSYKVTSITVEYIQNFFDVTNMFYGYSFARAARNFTERNITHLSSIMEKIDKSVKNDDLETYLEQVAAFGEMILHVAKNPIILQSAMDLMPMAKRIFFLAIEVSPSHIKKSVKFVRLSYKNLLNREPEKAKKSFITFANISRDILLEDFKKQ